MTQMKPLIFVLLSTLGVVASMHSAAATASDTRGDADTVVAKRGAAIVTLGDVDTMIAQLPENVRSGYMDGPERIEKLIDSLLLSKQIAAEAREKNLDQGEEFQRRMDLDESNVLMQMRIGQYLEQLEQPDFSIMARELYDADSGVKYGVPENRDLSHILISTKSRTEEAAKKVADDLRARMDAGESFDELARVYSDDKPGNVPEGDLLAGEYWRMKRVLPGKTVPEFEAAAWALKTPGELSDVVKTQFGYHIIRLDGTHQAVKKPFEAVESRIVADLRSKWLGERRLQYVTGFQVQKLEADPAIVASLRTRYQPDPGDVKHKTIKAELSTGN